MTNTKVNKCKENSCTHNSPIHERYDIVDGQLIRKDNHKWHFCTTCDKVVHKDYINYHEMRCKLFHDTAKNCIAKGHYLDGTHSEHVACNL